MHNLQVLTCWFSSGPSILAQGRIQSLNAAFLSKEGNASTTVIMLVIGVLVTIATGVAYWIVKRRGEKKLDRPAKLFAELCRSHRLSIRQRQLLRKLAKAQDIDDPCQVFVDSKLWTLDPGKNAKFCKQRVRNQLRVLQRCLFNEESPAAAQP